MTGLTVSEVDRLKSLSDVELGRMMVDEQKKLEPSTAKAMAFPSPYIIFEDYWPLVKEKLCELYDEHGDVASDAVVEVAKQFGKLAEIIAIVICWGIKQGLDLLCEVEAAA